MTFTITKLKLAVAIVVMALLVPATAFATHSFTDVPDGEFYTDAVAWAKANGVTTGCGDGTTFCTNDPVTRAQNITFAKRYDDFVVQPALTTLTGTAAANSAAIVSNDTDIAALEVGLFDSDTILTGASTNSLSPVDIGLKATVTIPTGHTAVIEIGFSAESSCSGGVGTRLCKVAVLVNGTAVDDTASSFNNTDSGSANATALSMTRVTGELPPGTYEITATHNTTNASTFHDTVGKVLTATVHFLS